MDRSDWIEIANDIKAVGRIPVIAEIKPYSPTCGDLLQGRDVDQIIENYILGGAGFISVVTGKWFHGNLALLAQVAKRTDLPILRKDFIVNKDQINASKDNGASAVLLTKKLLKTDHLMALADYCIAVGMVPFIEVADVDEIKKLQLNSHAVIAVNNKNICVKETDNAGIEKSVSLVKEAENCGAGLKVSASGISNPKEARCLFQTGFDVLLIGTALLQAEDTEKMLKDFTQINCLEKAL